jgi:hypothetical protein
MNALRPLTSKSETMPVSLAFCARVSEGCEQAVDATQGAELRIVTIQRKKPGAATAATEELKPHPDPPAEHCMRRIIMTIAGKRYELTNHVEVRAITKGPAKVIEMPKRAAI